MVVVPYPSTCIDVVILPKWVHVKITIDCHIYATIILCQHAWHYDRSIFWSVLIIKKNLNSKGMWLPNHSHWVVLEDSGVVVVAHSSVATTLRGWRRGRPTSITLSSTGWHFFEIENAVTHSLTNISKSPSKLSTRIEIGPIFNGTYCPLLMGDIYCR